jgi:signal transduction histidine kinase
MAIDGAAVDDRVLVVAPTRRDGEVTSELLPQACVSCVLCADVQALTAQFDASIGAVLLTDRTLADPKIGAFLAALGRQPEWSDVPVLVLMADREQSPPAARVLSMLTNVTLLDRPPSTRAMVSAVLAALRARRRQFQVRDQNVERLKAEQALRDADRRKNEFLATLAHELRNPLAPIRTGLEVLARVPGDSAHAARLRTMMERQLEQLVKLIDDLLDVSRIVTGKVVLQRERVDLRRVVESAVEATQPFVDAARLSLSVDCGDHPVWVIGDASRLAQVVNNLIHNATKYTPSGGGLRILLRSEPGEAVVQVIDTGVGIPRDMLEQVFEMFTQLERVSGRTQDGLGIGLSLVRRLVQLHGGAVAAVSAGAGRGSTFTVRLPTVEPLPAGRPGTAPTAQSPRAPRRVRVLVVDDNVDAADALAIQLQTSGHQTRIEYSGARAVEAAHEFEPEVVFCDIGMSDMDGHEVAKRLRADQRHATTVLVAITGWGSEEDKRRTRDTGFDYHLVKPVSPTAVEDLLAQL